MKSATIAVSESPPSDLLAPSLFTYAGWLLESAATRPHFRCNHA